MQLPRAQTQALRHRGLIVRAFAHRAREDFAFTGIEPGQ